MSYSIQVLSDEEFEALPYPEVEMSLGLADRAKGVAYVRNTASDELNKYLINHELEHLTGEDNDALHERDGIYYKGFGNILSAVGGGISRAAGGAVNTVKSAGSSILNSFMPQASSQATPGIAGPVKSLSQQAVQNPALRAPAGYGQAKIAGIANPSALDMFKFANPGGSSSAMTTPSLSQINQQVASPTTFNPKPPQLPSTPNTIPTARPGATPSQTMSTAFKGFSGSLPQSTPTTPKPSAMGGFMKSAMEGINPVQTLMGLGSAGFGQAAAPQIEMPDISSLPSVQALKNLNVRNFQELDPQLVTAMENDFGRIEEQEMKRLVDTYKNLRPGADIESDSSYAKDRMELQRMQGERKQDALAKARFEFISKQLQMSELEMRQMTELANQDIYTIMVQLGLDAEGANSFKQTFSDIGRMFMSKGLGFDQAQVGGVNATQPA